MLYPGINRSFQPVYSDFPQVFLHSGTHFDIFYSNVQLQTRFANQNAIVAQHPARGASQEAETPVLRQALRIVRGCHRRDACPEL